MLSSRERLTRPQFTEILANKGPLVIYNRLGTLKYIPKYLSRERKLAVVTSGKHEKRAVMRNKLRCLLYTLFQQGPADMQGILYTSKASYGFSYEELQTLFNELLKKASK